MSSATPSPLSVTVLPTAPIEGQKPGTSGLRKKTRTFTADPLYLMNFVQATVDALEGALLGATLVVSGDGRFYTPEAVQAIVKVAAANGAARVWVGRRGLLSTPAVSAVIRRREGGAAVGGIILTASHNPGGPDEDFGVKYNAANGGPAPEALTDAIYAKTRALRRVRVCAALPDVDLGALGATTWTRAADGAEGEGEGGARLPPSFTVEVIDPVEDYAAVLAEQFDFVALRALCARPDFRVRYDGMNGVAGIYATRILGEQLGLPAEALTRCEPLPDFGGHHPDPNLTYAPELVSAMGLTRSGEPLAGAAAVAAAAATAVPDFGAAQDGDADRNMVLGARFFVTPSDSVAVIAANQAAIPAFARTGGLKGVARSMPTSCALDRVAAKLGLRLFEVPTGWKFFGNLMDSGLLGKEDLCPFLCGEESFGTGADHVREKDGLWAVLAWLSILAAANAAAPVGQLVSVEAIVRRHWATYGRNFYCRYDYENVEGEAAEALMAQLRGRIAAFAAAGAGARAGADAGAEALGVVVVGGGAFSLAQCDEFRYVDPVDGSVSDKQGLRFIMQDGSRVVYRLSGTGSVGATVRVYIEKLELDEAKQSAATADALRELVELAVGGGLVDVAKVLGRDAPTVIT
jgi:phosphoglucomutase